MAQQSIALGTGPGTAGADTHFQANTKVNANFTELYARPLGTDGDDGLNGKTILSGSTVPAAGLGTDGDFYKRVQLRAMA